MRKSAVISFLLLCSVADLPAQTLTSSTGADPMKQGPALHIRNPTRQTLKGTRVAVPPRQRRVPAPTEACLLTVTMPPGLKLLSGIEASPVRFHPDGTCEQDYDVGQPVEHQPATIQPNASIASAPEFTAVKASQKANQSQSLARSGAEASQPRPEIWGGTNSGYLYVYYLDPPPLNLIVNSVRTNMSWSSDTCCLTSVQGSPNYTQLTSTGWSRVSDDFGTYLTCELGSATAEASYVNLVFCGLFAGDWTDTWVDYFYVSTYGNNNDCNMTTSFWALASGSSCARLLRRAFTISQSQYCY
jgi:hypothetical protein